MHNKFHPVATAAHKAVSARGAAAAGWEWVRPRPEARSRAGSMLSSGHRTARGTGGERCTEQRQHSHAHATSERTLNHDPTDRGTMQRSEPCVPIRRLAGRATARLEALPTRSTSTRPSALLARSTSCRRKWHSAHSPQALTISALQGAGGGVASTDGSGGQWRGVLGHAVHSECAGGGGRALT